MTGENREYQIHSNDDDKQIPKTAADLAFLMTV